jgi:hypothetical protein
MKQLLKINNPVFIISIAVLYIAFCLIYNHLFLTEGILSQWYEGLLNMSQIQESIASARKWEWAIIFFNILYVFIRVSCVAGCLYLGLFFLAEGHHTYSTTLNIALKTEIVCLTYSVLRLCWYQFIEMPESMEAFQVMPLSLMCFFDPLVIEPWLIYPLNTLNLFEIFYVLLLAGLMATAVKTKFGKALELVFISYGSGILLVMVTQMFIILNNS